MTPRRFPAPAPANSPTQTPENALVHRLSGDRLPLEVSLSLALEILEAVADAHQRREYFGSLSAAQLVLLGDGSIEIVGSPSAVDESADVGELGEVLYHLFTGLTPAQAKAQLASRDVPEPSRINPAIDDGIDGLLMQMLSADPNQRPHSLRMVEAKLQGVCEELDLEPSRETISQWAEQTPPAPVPKMQLAVAPPRRRPAPVSDSIDDESSVVEVRPHAPLRFDAWAASACAFGIVAFIVVIRM